MMEIQLMAIDVRAYVCLNVLLQEIIVLYHHQYVETEFLKHGKTVMMEIQIQEMAVIINVI